MTKKNLAFELIRQQDIPKNKDVISDRIIRQTGVREKNVYPITIRLISFHDKGSNCRLVFLTNNFNLAASTIAELYKHRWQKEFFSKIKLDLKIKTFPGNSEYDVINSNQDHLDLLSVAGFYQVPDALRFLTA